MITVPLSRNETVILLQLLDDRWARLDDERAGSENFAYTMGLVDEQHQLEELKEKLRGWL